MQNPFYDEEIIAELLRMQQQDPDQLMDMVLHIIKQHPDTVVQDEHSAQEKLKALAKIRKHYEEAEKYEDCQLLAQLEKRIREGA